MPSADRLYEFIAVVDAGSISAAARQLGLPRATLSRRLSGLESDLGTRLLHRRTRSLVLTTAGKELRHRARRITADADAAWASVQRLDDTPRGLLRVSVAALTDPALYVDFLRDYPEVQLDVRATTRHVDLIADGIDVAVRFGPIKDQNLIVRRVHTARSIAVAAPSYVERNGMPATASELASHECILDFAGEWSPRRLWPLRDGGTVIVGGRLSANAVTLGRASAVAGQGIAILPNRLVANDIASGALVSVLEGTIGADLPISVVYADREHIEPKVRGFVERAAAYLKDMFCDEPGAARSTEAETSE